MSDLGENNFVHTDEHLKEGKYSINKCLHVHSLKEKKRREFTLCIVSNEL